MGRSFYEKSESARRLYDSANEVLGWDLKGVSFYGPASELERPECAQCSLYVHEFVAASELVRTNPDLRVSAVAGLSLGELTALAMAGVYDFATGLRIVAERARLMGECAKQAPGTMAAVVGATEAQLEGLIAACNIEIANRNCPGQVVVSGTEAGIENAAGIASALGQYGVLPLRVKLPGHSRLMLPAAEKFQNFLEGVAFNNPTCEVYANVSGELARTGEEIKGNLVRQLYSAVLWEKSFRAMIGAGVDRFWECGSGGVLRKIAQRIDRSARVRSVGEASDLRESSPEVPSRKRSGMGGFGLTLSPSQM